MLGGAGYVAYRAGKSSQQAQYHEQEQDAQLASMQQQPAADPQAQQYAAPPPAAPAPGAADTPAQRIEALSKLKELMDAGVLTQQEFDAQKQQLLGGAG
jgi:hypothetical protein